MCPRAWKLIFGTIRSQLFQRRMQPRLRGTLFFPACGEQWWMLMKCPWLWGEIRDNAEFYFIFAFYLIYWYFDLLYKKSKKWFNHEADDDTVSADVWRQILCFLLMIPVRRFLHGSVEMVPWGTVCKNRLEPRPRVPQTAVTLMMTVGLAALYHTEHNFGPCSFLKSSTVYLLLTELTILFLKQRLMCNI